MASFWYFSCLWSRSIAWSSREKYGFYRLTSELILELITRQLSHYAPLSHFAPRYSITLLNNEINLYMKKCFFQTYTIAIFHFFEKLFYYYECKLRNFYKNTFVFVFLWWSQKQPPEVFYKKVVLKKLLKNFAIFIGKHLCWSLFLIKLEAFRPDCKKDSNTRVFLWILQSFQEHLF